MLTSNASGSKWRLDHSNRSHDLSVQDTLRAARQGLAERDFLVAAHEHSEAALAGAAAALRAELAVTAGELTAVFAKVDELSGMAAANGAVVAGLRSDAAARLQVPLPVLQMLVRRAFFDVDLSATL